MLGIARFCSEPHPCPSLCDARAFSVYAEPALAVVVAPGGRWTEGLSGLAKAFFYAGSRALLVSHWPVASDAAVRITTRMLEEARIPGVGRAEAHRRAMLALIDDKDRPYFAHPLFWAPFVVVGEGGVIENKRSQ